ncbi:MAG TPA: KamA family radical SAM protein [Candidatus Eremiobacteraeota bacterium]|nr:MAG: Glutamate 2,3-aminomutase [bacterium ADurb.Bin363]HPZ09766.1 KamA family radical SAM protein [Candidatus Eremiobacteraeota bacterium]
MEKKALSVKSLNAMLKYVLEVDKPVSIDVQEFYLQYLWDINKEITEIFKSATDLEELRDKLYTYLDRAERELYSTDNKKRVLERDLIRESIKVFKNIIAPIHEKRTGISSLNYLWKLAKDKSLEISPAFILEFIALFKAISGKADVYIEHIDGRKIPGFVYMKGREAALKRTEALDEVSKMIGEYFSRYPSGMEEEIITRRKENAKRILKYFNGSEEDWLDYRWHLKYVIKDPHIIYDLLELKKDQQKAIKKAVTNKIPFGITPYYLSLMEYSIETDYAHAVRAQVIPPPDYVDLLSNSRMDRSMFDFMGEQDTSPVELITRRYPMIAILKPYNTCSQICVYCQRNWEIDECMAPKAQASDETINNALKWLSNHPGVGDVLVTGGDPMIMNDEMIDHLLKELSSMDHIFRIRFGTRTPVVLPQRWTDKLSDLLGKYHSPGKREIAVITHFVHSAEITPEARDAVRKIRLRGMGVYNQEVFNIENSRRFESAKLRHDLKLTGVDPYYTFNMKGKKETRRYMVPIARILQERKEEARLLPGLSRTDETVFNVPRMGKNHLRAWQDHDIIMILPDGSRIYQFHPWEKNITLVPAYDYNDVPIYDYLQELLKRGEDIRDYRTIWYYY